MAALETFVLRTIAELEALAPEWAALLPRTQSSEIFRSWTWISSWWEVFGTEGDRQPFVIGVRQGATLVGLAPFLLRTVVGAGPIGIRRLEFMGTGEDERDEVCSDFPDLLAVPGVEDEVASAVWKQLLDERPRWDHAEFRNVLDDSLLVRILEPLARAAASGQTRKKTGERFWIDLSGGDFNRYVEGLSKKRKKRIFYYRRRLEKEGGMVERRLERREDIPLFLAEIARLSCLRLSQRGKASAWGSEKFRRFHDRVAPRLWDLGWLDLRLWVKDGRAVAALYNLVYDGTIYYYQSGFDTAAFGNISPGLVTISHVIEWGFAQKARRYDFLVGQGGSYKEDYACLTAPASHLTFYNQTLRGQAQRCISGVRQFLSDARAGSAGLDGQQRQNAAPVQEESTDDAGT